MKGSCIRRRSEFAGDVVDCRDKALAMTYENYNDLVFVTLLSIWSAMSPTNSLGGVPVLPSPCCLLFYLQRLKALTVGRNVAPACCISNIAAAEVSGATPRIRSWITTTE